VMRANEGHKTSVRFIHSCEEKGCFGLLKTAIGEWASMGRKTSGHDEACWTISDGWADRKMSRGAAGPASDYGLN
jgi:hypothetical protein